MEKTIEFKGIDIAQLLGPAAANLKMVEDAVLSQIIVRGSKIKIIGDESEVLLSTFRTHLEEFRANNEAAESLIKIGELPADEGLVPAELAAWTMLTNLLLNLDEVLTKG